VKFRKEVNSVIFRIQKYFSEKSFEEEKDFPFLSFASEFSLHLARFHGESGEEKESSIPITKHEPEAD